MWIGVIRRMRMRLRNAYARSCCWRHSNKEKATMLWKKATIICRPFSLGLPSFHSFHFLCTLQRGLLSPFRFTQTSTVSRRGQLGLDRPAGGPPLLQLLLNIL
jgi:hypothetical protein